MNSNGCLKRPTSLKRSDKGHFNFVTGGLLTLKFCRRGLIAELQEKSSAGLMLVINVAKGPSRADDFAPSGLCRRRWQASDRGTGLNSLDGGPTLGSSRRRAANMSADR